MIEPKLWIFGKNVKDKILHSEMVYETKLSKKVENTIDSLKEEKDVWLLAIKLLL